MNPLLLNSTYAQSRGLGSKDQNAQTPVALYQRLDAEFHFQFDPCPVNPTFNGLSVPWRESNYVNPPYRYCRAWLTKAISEWRVYKRCSVFLIPFRPETRYYQELVWPYANEIRVLRQPVTFQNYQRPLKSRLALIIFGYNPALGYHVHARVPSRIDIFAAQPSSSITVRELKNQLVPQCESWQERPTAWPVKKWQACNIFWVNAHCVEFMAEAERQLAEHGRTTCLIIPCRPDGGWFLPRVLEQPKMQEIWFFAPRLVAPGHERPSPFASMAVVYRPGPPLSLTGPPIRVV